MSTEGTEGADQRYLLAREMDMWQAEAERTQNQVDGLQHHGGSEEATERAWYQYCFRKHETVAWELDKIENPPRHSAANVADESLDDLDRQTE
ncbi:MAG: hypothetical protein JO280_02805 [Mycobacteriaceae bacterium]|nr:hypothetical protein [Mycobacteriaceae bacterium]